MPVILALEGGWRIRSPLFSCTVHSRPAWASEEEKERGNWEEKEVEAEDLLFLLLHYRQQLFKFITISSDQQQQQQLFKFITILSDHQVPSHCDTCNLPGPHSPCQQVQWVPKTLLEKNH